MTDPTALFELGVQALAERRVHDALMCFDRAEESGAGPEDCAAQRWFCWMLLGDFERSWRECDAIAQRKPEVENCFWDGRPFDGKRIIVRCLHGYGDAVQFVRYLPLLRERASRVIVETHPALVSLMREQSYIDEAITWADKSAVPEWDQQIEVMELPRAFRSSVKTIPREVPYLRIPGRVAAWCARRLAPYPGLRVGLVWAASDWNLERNIPADLLGPLLATPGVSFFSFQHGPHRDDLPKLQRSGSISDMAPVCPEIVDTAAALTQVDLLITVDTLAAHLAGALGCPVWTLLHWQADWRWMLEREDSPWYPTMRLFRQTQPGDWRRLIDRVAGELSSLSYPLIRTTRTAPAPSSTVESEARSIVNR